MVEAVGGLEAVQVPQVGDDSLLEGVELLHLVAPAGVGLGVVEHRLLVVHQRQQPRVEVRGGARPPAQPALVLLLELRLPPGEERVQCTVYSVFVPFMSIIHLEEATGALCPVRSSASSLVPHMRPLELGFTRRSPQRLPWLVFL